MSWVLFLNKPGQIRDTISPVLTILEACIFGAIYLALILFGLDYILRKIEFDKIERIIALCFLFYQTFISAI